MWNLSSPVACRAASGSIPWRAIWAKALKDAKFPVF